MPEVRTKHWCRGCGAYGEGPCVNVGHISEVLRLVGAKWQSFKKPKLVIATPPVGGRGSVEFVPCDAQGKPVK